MTTQTRPPNLRRFALVACCVVAPLGAATAQEPAVSLWLQATDGTGKITVDVSQTAVIQLWMDIGSGYPLVNVNAILRGYDAAFGKNLSFEVQGFNDIVISNSQLQLKTRGAITNDLPNGFIDNYQYVGEDPTALNGTDGISGPRTVLLDEIIIHGTQPNTGIGADTIFFEFGTLAPGGFYMDFVAFPPPGTWTIAPLTTVSLGTGNSANPFLVNVTGTPTGSCCVSITDCQITTQVDCDSLGGIYRGDFTDCPQEIKRNIHTGGAKGTHEIIPPADCVPFESGLARGPACTPGPPFIDAWMTDAGGGSCVDFGAPSSTPIPADFFGPGSDPFDGVICFIGVPLGATQFGQYDLADTLILRSDDPFARCDAISPTPVTVDLEIVALNLVSIAPMTVTFNGGQNPEQWDVAMTLSDFHTDADPGNDPPLGTATVTKTHCNGGTYSTVVNVLPKFTVTKVGDPGQVLVLDTGLDGQPFIPMTYQGGDDEWVHQLDPLYALDNPTCSDFIPGVQENSPSTTCTCITIVSALSLLDHGGTELSLDVMANNIEPRLDGVRKIEFGVSDPVTTVSASVICDNTTFNGLVNATANGNAVTVDLAPLPDKECCTVALHGDLSDSIQVRPLAGDIDRDGAVTTGDALIIKPHFNGDPAVEGPEFDFNVDGTITTSDFSQVKPLFNNLAPACP